MRPRRFGKTLNLSMIKYYFEKTFDQDGKEENNSYLFDGLNIMASGEAYTSHLGQYPVISLSLKSAKQPDFPRAYAMLKRQIAKIKVADTYAQLNKKAESALDQIEQKQYDAELKLEGYHEFIKYGISFYKTLCKVLCI